MQPKLAGICSGETTAQSALFHLAVQTGGNHAWCTQTGSYPSSAWSGPLLQGGAHPSLDLGICCRNVPNKRHQVMVDLGGECCLVRPRRAGCGLEHVSILQVRPELQRAFSFLRKWARSGRYAAISEQQCQAGMKPACPACQTSPISICIGALLPHSTEACLFLL